MFFTYRQGNVDIGAVYEWMKLHEGPQSRNTRAAASTSVTRDETLEDAGVYIMYNNGRFFFNFELDFVRGQINYQVPSSPLAPVDPGDGGGSPYAPVGAEAWKVFLGDGRYVRPRER